LCDRRFFKDMEPNALDKKSNMEYVEKEVGLKRFFPKAVMDKYKVGRDYRGSRSRLPCLFHLKSRQRLDQQTFSQFVLFHLKTLRKSVCPDSVEGSVDTKSVCLASADYVCLSCFY